MTSAGSVKMAAAAIEAAAVATAKSAQDRHRNHRRRNRGGDGQPGEQSEIGVRGREDHHQCDRKRYSADAQLRRSLGAH
jgi:hypothetical protein